MPLLKNTAAPSMDGLREFRYAAVVSTERAEQLSPEQYHNSSLVNKMVRNMVYRGAISFEDALTLSDARYKQTALSSPHIQFIVMDLKLPVARALLIPLAEIENPIATLQEQKDLTPDQELRLELYLENPGIGPDEVERIIFLHSKNPIARIEKLELELLLSPTTRHYTNAILILVMNDERTPQDERLLSYYHYPRAMPCARLVTALEFRQDRTEEQTAKLEECYLKICCKIYAPHPGLTAAMQFVELVHNRRGRQNAPPAADPTATTKTSIQAAIRRIIVTPTVQHRINNSPSKDPNNWPGCSRESVMRAWNKLKAAPMAHQLLQDYVATKTATITFKVVQYFADPRTLDFSGENLNVLLTKVKDKLDSGEWTLGELGDFRALDAVEVAAVDQHTTRPGK